MSNKSLPFYSAKELVLNDNLGLIRRSCWELGKAICVVNATGYTPYNDIEYDFDVLFIGVGIDASDWDQSLRQYEFPNEDIEANDWEFYLSLEDYFARFEAEQTEDDDNLSGEGQEDLSDE